MNEKKVFYTIIAVLSIILAVCVYGIYDNRGRVDHIREQLDEVKQYNTDSLKRIDTIQRGIDSSTERLESSGDRIISVEKRIHYSQEQLGEGADIIRQDQQIYKAVRDRK